jgi:ribulose-5-phosphate 4-epimerase/fuculose-1-phosphate aldolase
MVSGSGPRSSNHPLHGASASRTACRLANHGSIVLGHDLPNAMWRAVELETIAQQYFNALLPGGPVPNPAQWRINGSSPNGAAADRARSPSADQAGVPASSGRTISIALLFAAHEPA